MSVTYRKMFLRWDVLRGWMPGIVFFLVSVGIELLFFSYVTSRGLVDQTINIPVSTVRIPLSIVLLFCLGNAVFLLTVWMGLFENTAYVMAGPDRKVRRILYPLRMLRAAALVLAPFTLVLFTPYLVQSGWFLGSIGSVTQLRGFAVSFYSWASGTAKIDPSLKFVGSQLSAAVAAAAVSGLQMWRVKGTRNLMLALRRRK
ncbi:MAG TPA: hypothetical protein VFE98_10455 [Candidatus Bathyarchaeia archaeon]|nr:hypothetical protein [Candidatus Bathyarchaeia archaeon]